MKPLAMRLGCLFILAMLLGMQGGVIRVEDFGGYWCAAKINWQGGNPYDAEQVLALERTIEPDRRAPQIAWGTPWSLAIVTPWIFFDFATARWLWLLAEAVGVTVAAAALWMTYGGSARGRVLCLPFCFLFYPTLLLLGVGQISLMNLLALAGFLAFFQRRADFRAGLAVSLMAAKAQVLILLAVVLALWIAQQRRWLVAAGIFVGLLLQTAIVMAPNPHVLAMYLEALTRRGPTDFIPATPGTLLRFAFGQQSFWPALLPLALGLVWLAWRYGRHFRSWNWQREMPALTFACYLSSPYAHNYDLVILLVPLTRAAVVSLNRSRASFVTFFTVVFLNSLGALVMNQLEWEEYQLMWLSPALLVVYLWFCRGADAEPRGQHADPPTGQ